MVKGVDYLEEYRRSGKMNGFQYQLRVPAGVSMAKGRKKNSTAADEAREEYLVFVSHATADKWIAKVICERLEQAGGCYVP